MENLNHLVPSKYLHLREDIHPPVRLPGVKDHAYRRELSSWYGGLNPERQILHEILRGQIFGLLGVTGPEQIQPLIDNPKQVRQTSNMVLDRLGQIYGIRGRGRI